MNKNQKVFVGFMAGLAVGTVIGVLLAPDKGDDTRKMLMERAKMLGNDLEAGDFNAQLDRVSDIAKTAIDTVNNYAQKLLHYQNGEA